MAWWTIASLHHALVVTAFALGAWLVSRFLKSPAIGHIAWILVLIKLFTPPLVAIPVSASWPAIDSPYLEHAGIIMSLGWALGTFLMAAWIVSRGYAFHRMIRLFSTRCPIAEEQVRELAGLLNLRHVPRLAFLDVRTTPLVWGVGPAATIVLPTQLWASASPVARDTMLIHELSHIRRGDPWIRLLEAIAMTVFWWHPAVWVARREIAACEEECCDAESLRTFPHSPRDYAESVLQALEFASGPPPALAMATGLRSAGTLTRRLTFIMRPPSTRLTRHVRAALVLSALLTLRFDVIPHEKADSPPAAAGIQTMPNNSAQSS